MDKRIKLSIIAPVYGVEKYIREYLGSLYNQDISEDEYEVILVNDCSKDNSEQIIKEFASTHNNLRLINHKVNKGVNAARNTGYEVAVGKYIWFNDPDDYIAPNCLGHIISTCEKYDLDCYHWAICETTGRVKYQTEDTEITTGINHMLKYCEITFPWNRVYKKSILDNHSIHFIEKDGHDVLHTIEATSVCQRMKDSSNCFYFYRSSNPTSKTNTNPHTAKRQMDYVYILGADVIELANKLAPEIRDFVQSMGIWRFNKYTRRLLKMPISEVIRFYKDFNKDQHLKATVLQYCNRINMALLKNPRLVIIINPFYRLLSLIRHRQ